jgi:hypothetical protein
MIKQMLKWQIINKFMEEPDHVDQAFLSSYFALKPQKTIILNVPDNLII